MSDPGFHGGDARGIARSYGGTPADYRDFSANINPFGPPPGVRAMLRAYARSDALQRYPEPGLPGRVDALAHACGVESANILVHAGSAVLFDTLVRAYRPRRIGVCAPAFAEYARAAAANDVALATFILDPWANPPFPAERFRQWVRAEGVDFVMLTNPHNPLGFALDAQAMRDVITDLGPVTFIVDEAFADYADGVSLVRDAAADPRLVEVRSLTKFYAMPDLRVGYAVLNPQTARAVRQYLPAWPVSGIAADAARVALADSGFAERTRDTNARDRATLAAGLADLGLRAVPARANFLCFAAGDVFKLRERLIVDHRIIVRDCTSFGGLTPDEFVRVAVRAPADNAQLLAALRTVRYARASASRVSLASKA